MNTHTFALAVLLTSPGAAQAPAAQPAQSPAEKRGLLTASEGATPGYTLFAPLQSHTTYLIDNAGNVAHEWTSDAPPGQSVYLLENGHLLRTERVESATFFGGGQGGRVREFDWGGKLVWEYQCADETKLQHHDIEPLANGNVLVIAWEMKSEAEALAAGRDPALLTAREMWPDMVLEIEPVRPSGGKVVWEWHAWDHLVQDFDKTKANFGDVAASLGRIDLNVGSRPARAPREESEELARLRKLGYVGDEPPQRRDGPMDGGMPTGMRGGDWMHTNAIDYEPKLDLILLSIHETSEIWVIDHSTTSAEARTSSGGRYGKGGDILWRFGNPSAHRGGAERALWGQHDAQWITTGLPGAGHILLFNNGSRGERASSSVDEIAVDLSAKAFENGARPAATLAWTYTAPEIFSERISGAQRLANGNTLACAGESGRVREVDASGAIVWDFLSTLGGDKPMPMGRGRPTGRPGERDGREREGEERRGPPPGAGPPGGDFPGRRGPSPNGMFRAWRYAPDYAGVAALAKPKSE